MKTFLRRPGNKSNHLRHIIPLFPEKYKDYYEPFLGTGAVFLDRLENLPGKWIINDLNKDIIDIWKLVRDDPGYLLSQIDLFKKNFIPLSNEDKLKTCKKIVSKLESYPSKKRTVMYLLMVYCCMKGSIERNNTYSFDCLYSHIYNDESVHVFTEKYKEKIKRLSILLIGGKIFNTDYKKILNKAKQGDFVFIDPPYVEEKSYTFQYNRIDTFNILELLIELQKLDGKKVKWMMTQIDNKLARDVFREYKFYNYLNKNCISKSPGKKELVITNY